MTGSQAYPPAFGNAVARHHAQAAIWDNEVPDLQCILMQIRQGISFSFECLEDRTHPGRPHVAVDLMSMMKCREVTDEIDKKASSGLKAMRSWFVTDFALEAVSSLVDADTKPSIRDAVWKTRLEVESALNLVAEAQRAKEDLFLNIAKAASSAQHMLDQIRKNYGATDEIANKKKALTEKWLENEKMKLREAAEDATQAANASKRCAAEALHSMLKVPSSAWGPVLHQKMHEWMELEATEEAARVAKLQAAGAIRARVRESATPQKHGQSLLDDADLEASCII
ncbi:hypothetical protein AK812_SmicGene1197 [Symbiodinium microadriaticum]|uniref:Uncharacterized protein n=1 Tax=Symbiodinium microadriaticum TaxID=2951 RepID=A0A1Q9F4N6_SYMMI|nr:hypothetical protein AK812_SmicGene1197 [Symbiodinium microadriaticum]